uniref:J domain-containing protein n=1 Tax=viral metagenome TaxID=1070528 RepID=A0A6C0HTU6_9ZZZZ
MDYYKILEVDNNATQEEIKKSYRKLSLKYHPDRSGNNDNKKIQEINEAYEILGDEAKRQGYDFELKFPLMGGMGGMGGMPFPMENLFEQIFFGNSESPNIRVFQGFPTLDKPTPIIKTFEINMDVVLTGGNVPIEIERWIFQNGEKQFEKETIYLDIPKGIDDNELLILRDKGNIKDKNIGDIKIFIKVNNNTKFQRNGLDLFYEKTISLKDALCGFSFDLKYINGKKYTINNQKGNIIPPNFKKIIPNMGIERNGYVGNLIISFSVHFPENLSTEIIDKIKDCL